MTKEALKDQALKQLESSRAAEVVARPGRLPKHKPKEAFIHRVRQQEGGDAGRIATSRLRHREIFARVARLSLTALNRLIEEFGPVEAYSVASRPKKSQAAENKNDMSHAHEMLRELLQALTVATYEGFAASIILEEDGKLRSKNEDNSPRGLYGANADRDPHSYSPLRAYRHDPVVRLDK